MLICFFDPIEVQVPVLKGQYDVTDNQFTWVGVVGTEINMKCSGEWEVVILSSGRQVNSVILLLFLLKVIRVSPILATIMDTFGFKAEIPKRVYERNVKLEFTALEGRYQVIGVGTNEFGSFTLLGTYNPETKELNCTKE